MIEGVCDPCGKGFRCAGDVRVGDRIECTHECCLVCQMSRIFGTGLVVSNTLAVQKGIAAGYYNGPDEPEDPKDPGDWEAEYEEERLANDIDPFSGNRYGEDPTPRRPKEPPR